MSGLAVLACIAVYYWLGIRLVARPFVTTQVAKHVRHFPTRSARLDDIDEERRFAAVGGLMLAAVWPFVLIGRLLVGRLAASAPLCDAEARELLKQRDRRVAELERELGMRR